MISDQWPTQNQKSKSEWLAGKTSKFALGLLLAGISLGFLAAFAGNHLVSLLDTQPAAKPAPDFEIPLFGADESFQLSHYRGQGVVINFWASWCHPCRQEMSLLESSWRTYRDQGVVFVGVDVWDSEADAKAFLQEFDVTYPTGLDATSEIAKLYALQGVPTTLFIAPDGTINHIILGLLNSESLAQAVEEIIPKP